MTLKTDQASLTVLHSNLSIDEYGDMVIKSIRWAFVDTEPLTSFILSRQGAWLSPSTHLLGMKKSSLTGDQATCIKTSSLCSHFVISVVIFITGIFPPDISQARSKPLSLISFSRYYKWELDQIKTQYTLKTLMNGSLITNTEKEVTIYIM